MYGLDQPKRHELEKQKLEFAFKRNEQEEALDPDKRRLVPDRRPDDPGYLDDAIRGFDGEPVSYTHLTLPTILLV